MTPTISSQMEALQRFVDWRRRTQRQTPIEEDLGPYQAHLEVESALDRLSAVREILAEPFEANDPNLVDRLREVVQ